MKLIAKFEPPRQTTTPPRRSKAPLVAPSPAPAEVEPAASPGARNLALAHRLANMIDTGLVADYTAAARLIGCSQPRLTHLMSLLLLAPQIQEAILFGRLTVGDKRQRELARIAAWSEQLDSLSPR